MAAGAAALIRRGGEGTLLKTAGATIGHQFKRWLYIVHRWIGIVTCLLFAIWFVSGLVMIYVPYPSLTATERLAGLEAIDWQKVKVGPAQAVESAASTFPPRTVILEMAAGQPWWRIVTEGAEITRSATDGTAIKPVGAPAAAAIAADFGRRPVAATERVEHDQWTVASGFDAHRPLWRARLAGPERRDLYVSSKTGSVVQDTTSQERFWNWLGSIPHWIYPTILRQDQNAWRQVVMWVSGPCILVAVTGIWIGLLRTRIGKRRFGQGRMTPYHGWMFWHHVAGLAGGITLTLWIFSGWLSVDPGRMFESSGLDPAAKLAFAGSGPPPPVAVARLAEAGPDARRIVFEWAAGTPIVTIIDAGGSRMLDAARLTSLHVDRQALVERAAGLVPGAPIASVRTLTDPDLYWYEVFGRPQLPVIRLTFDDASATWIHVDPATGRLLGDIDRTRRTYRWLFDMFHRWDLNMLTQHRPARDVLVWAFSVIGLVTSVSGIWIGWRRLRRPKSVRRNLPTPA